jgi:hypothetical protein
MRAVALCSAKILIFIFMIMKVIKYIEPKDIFKTYVKSHMYLINIA